MPRKIWVKKEVYESAEEFAEKSGLTVQQVIEEAIQRRLEELEAKAEGGGWSAE